MSSVKPQWVPEPLGLGVILTSVYSKVQCVLRSVSQGKRNISKNKQMGPNQT